MIRSFCRGANECSIAALLGLLCCRQILIFCLEHPDNPNSVQSALPHYVYYVDLMQSRCTARSFIRESRPTAGDTSSQLPCALAGLANVSGRKQCHSHQWAFTAVASAGRTWSKRPLSQLDPLHEHAKSRDSRVQSLARSPASTSTFAWSLIVLVASHPRILQSAQPSTSIRLRYLSANFRSVTQYTLSLTL